LYVNTLMTPMVIPLASLVQVSLTETTFLTSLASMNLFTFSSSSRNSFIAWSILISLVNVLTLYMLPPRRPYSESRLFKYFKEMHYAKLKKKSQPAARGRGRSNSHFAMLPCLTMPPIWETVPVLQDGSPGTGARGHGGTGTGLNRLVFTGTILIENKKVPEGKVK